MESMGSILQYYRKMRGYTQTRLAEELSKCGYPIKNGAISAWEKDYSTPNAVQFLALCQILNITDIYQTFVGGITTAYRTVPLRSMGVSAGYGEYVDDESVADYVEINNGEADYALRINGDSMEPLYPDDQIVLVQKTELLQNGDIGIFYVDGEQYCKQLLNNHLVSINDKYPPIDIGNSDCFKILGKVVGKYG